MDQLDLPQPVLMSPSEMMGLDALSKAVLMKPKEGIYLNVRCSTCVNCMVDAAAAAVANGIDPVISPNVYSPLPCIL
jgi:hypothetical protein